MPTKPLKKSSSLSAIAARVGNRVRAARVAAGLSQTELARDSGLTATLVGNVERGLDLCSLRTLLLLSIALRVSPSDLLLPAPATVKPAAAPLPDQSEEQDTPAAIAALLSGERRHQDEADE